MEDRTPSRDTLDPIERASIDELQALQLTRLQCSLRHAYDNVPHYRRAFEAAGVHPGRLQGTRRSRPVSPPPASPISGRIIRSACSPYPGSGSPGSTPPPEPPANRPSSATPRRCRHVGHCHGPLDPGRGRSTRRSGAHRLWIRPFHRRARRTLRRGAVGLHGHPGLRWDDRTTGHPDQGLRTGFHHGHPVVHAVDHRRDGAAGHRSDDHVLETGHLRCRTLDQRHAAWRWNHGWTCMPSTSTACRR